MSASLPEPDSPRPRGQVAGKALLWVESPGDAAERTRHREVDGDRENEEKRPVAQHLAPANPQPDGQDRGDHDHGRPGDRRDGAHRADRCGNAPELRAQTGLGASDQIEGERERHEEGGRERDRMLCGGIRAQAAAAQLEDRARLADERGDPLGQVVEGVVAGARLVDGRGGHDRCADHERAHGRVHRSLRLDRGGDEHEDEQKAQVIRERLERPFSGHAAEALVVEDGREGRRPRQDRERSAKAQELEPSPSAEHRGEQRQDERRQDDPVRLEVEGKRDREAAAARRNQPDERAKAPIAFGHVIVGTASSRMARAG
jgi:hypothetical protein